MSEIYNYNNPMFESSEYKQGKDAEKLEKLYLQQAGKEVIDESLVKRAKGDICFKSPGKKEQHVEVKSCKKDGILYFNIIEEYYHYENIEDMGDYKDAANSNYCEHHSIPGWFTTEKADFMSFWTNMGFTNYRRRLMFLTNGLKAVLFAALKEITGINYDDVKDFEARTEQNTFMLDRYATIFRAHLGSYDYGNIWLNIMPEKDDMEGHPATESYGDYEGTYIRHNVYQIAIKISYLEQLMREAGYKYNDKKM